MARTQLGSLRLLCGAVVLALATGVLIGRLWGSPSEEAPKVQVVRHAGTPPPEAPSEDPDAPLPSPDELPPEAETYPEHFRELEGDEEIETIPPTVEFPVMDKLVGDSLSPVPHQVMGAWDEAGEREAPGRRRALVLVVSEGATDAQIEALARDVRRRHRDASILDARIYDDPRAPLQSRALDGGRMAFEHLVGEVKRNEAVDLDSIRVRGRRIDP